MCPFNAMHMLPERDMKNHYEECEDRKMNCLLSYEEYQDEGVLEELKSNIQTL